MIDRAKAAQTRHRFLCPRCRSALTPWLRELALPEAVCVRGDETTLLPDLFFANRDAPVFGDEVVTPYEGFPWLLAPLGARWLSTHPDPSRAALPFGPDHTGEGKPNLLCPRGHEVGIGYRGAQGPHWYGLSPEVEKQSERDPTPLADPAPKLERALGLVDRPLPAHGRFAPPAADIRHDQPDRWLDALWLEAPSLECAGGQAAPVLALRAKGMPEGAALFLHIPWPHVVRLLCLDCPPWGTADMPLSWQSGGAPKVNLSRYDDFVLLSLFGRDPPGQAAVVFDAAEWSAAWARLRGEGLARCLYRARAGMRRAPPAFEGRPIVALRTRLTLLNAIRPPSRGLGCALALAAAACVGPPRAARPPRAAAPAPALSTRPPPPPSRAPLWAIARATVLDLRDGSARRDQTVAIEGGTIVAVGPSNSLPTEGFGRVLDAGGAYVMPGLWDMHVHLGDPYALRLFLANGVTGVRVMWGNPPPAPGGPARPTHDEMRRAIASGELDGPRLAISSSIFDGPKPFWPGSTAIATPDEGRRAVERAAASGADFIKVYTGLPRAAFFAIADESRARGIPFVGHAPDAVRLLEASEAGQRSIEHPFGLSLACSSREEELRRRRPLPPYDAAFARAMVRQERAARASYDGERARALFERLKANGTWSCPTLAVALPRDWATALTDDMVAYVPERERSWWRPPLDKTYRAAQLVFDEYAREAWRSTPALVARMREAGVPLLAGTDEGNPFLVPGFSLHEELSLLVEAGLTPLEALQSATTGPARFFGREGELGAVEAGKLADLVMLEADPRADVRRAARPLAVVAAGRLYDRAALDGLLADARHVARGPLRATVRLRRRRPPRTRGLDPAERRA